jgi:glycosyltransferase involved in cell wall biosynthesis
MTTEDALVSVVVPVFNGDRFICRTLASALAQTYNPIEVLVVDDGSTDRTPIVVEEAAANDPRVRYFRIDNSGVASARNFGINKARGEFIATLDADDLWHPEKIARQVSLMNTLSAETGLVYCWAIEIDENDLVIPSTRHLGRRHEYEGHVTTKLAAACFIHTSSAPLIKRSYINIVGGYDPDLKPHGAEDWKFYLSLSEVCEFAVISEFLVGYRQSSGSISKSHRRMGQSQELVAQWIAQKWPDLSDRVESERTYNINAYLTQLALSNNHFIDAFRYMGRAIKARPVKLFNQATVRFFARLLFRMTGLTGALLRRRGWTKGRPISYYEFVTETAKSDVAGSQPRFRPAARNVNSA